MAFLLNDSKKGKLKQLTMTIKDIRTVIILVEFQDGVIRQVLYDKELKLAILHMIADDQDGLKVSEKIEFLQIDRSE